MAAALNKVADEAEAKANYLAQGMTLEEMAPLLPVVNGLNSIQFTWCVVLLILACLSDCKCR